MKVTSMKPSLRRALVALAAFCLPVFTTSAAPTVLNPNLQIRLVMNTTNPSGANSVRIAKDPRNNQLYFLKINGDIYRVNLQLGNGSTAVRAYTAADHGLSTSVEGFAIGPDGTIYVLGNTTTNSTMNLVRISKGVPNTSGTRVWSTLARTVP